MSYAKTYAFKYATNFINDSVTLELLNKVNEMNLFNISRNSNNEIEMVDYDTLYVNVFLKDVTEKLEKSISSLSSDNYPSFSIRLGEVTNNPLLNYLGPSIDVYLKPIGTVLTNIYTLVTEYGINNSLIEMGVNISINVQVMLPIKTDVIVVNNKVPISYKIVTGKVPSYYGGSISKNSDIFSIPIE